MAFWNSSAHPHHEVGIALFGLFLFGLSTLGSYFDLYQKLWWFDIPMHMCGGFWSTLIILVYFYSHRVRGEKPASLSFVFLLGVGGGLLVGLGWEVFEYIFTNIIATVPWDPVDTSADVLNDVIGGVLGVFLYRYLLDRVALRSR